MRKVCLIVPCYDEAERFDERAFREIAAHPEITLLFVDDGSRDETPARLAAFCEALDDRATWLQLPRNGGKAEAVRQGLLRALEEQADLVAYTDADLAAPVEEVYRVVDALLAEDADVVMGSRIRYLGTQIRRSPHRHYLGRIFATLASLLLRLPVYDTQCGLKAFRRTPALEAALAEPFQSRWCFDVELLARLLIGGPGVEPVARGRIRELPLLAWSEVPGSKLRGRALGSIGLEMLRIARDVHRRRARLGRV